MDSRVSSPEKQDKENFVDFIFDNQSPSFSRERTRKLLKFYFADCVFTGLEMNTEREIEWLTLIPKLRKGLILVLPCIDVFVKVDLRTITCNIPPQEILTRDSVTTQVDGVVYYRVYSAVSAVANVNNVHQATFLLAQTTLRNVLGTQTLSQILAGREEIAHSIQTLLDDATDLWGIRVARVEIKDVRIPVQLQRSMAAEAEAAREARAKVLAAEGEMNASKSLKSASMVLAESPIALQLRYLQTLSTVATEKNSTIVFPLPMNILEGIGGISYDNHKKLPNKA
nr:stomatin-like protein 3 [Macaca nemestrina]